MTTPPSNDRTVRQTDAAAKEKMKYHADKKAKPHELKLGDLVLIPAAKANKLSPLFKPDPYRVVAIKGTMITASNGTHTVTRNASLLKRCPHLQLNDSPEPDEDQLMDDVLDAMRTTAPRAPRPETSPCTSSPSASPRRAATPGVSPGRPRRATKHPEWQKDFIMG